MREILSDNGHPHFIIFTHSWQHLLATQSQSLALNSPPHHVITLLTSSLPFAFIILSTQTEVMAAVTSAAVAIPSFTGLKAAVPAKPAASARVPTPLAPRLAVRASLKDAIGAAAVATAASAVLAGNAMAIEVLLGADGGELVFAPSNFTVSSGEKIVFKNYAGFPHNVVFIEDEVPSGVDAAKISMSDEELLNAPGETYAVTLTEKGTYSFYCSPHQGAGMVGKVTVN